MVSYWQEWNWLHERSFNNPRGIYNNVQIPVSENYPQGQIVVPLEKISDKPIIKGDSLKTVLRECIVKPETKVSTFTFFNRQNNEWRTIWNQAIFFNF